MFDVNVNWHWRDDRNFGIYNEEQNNERTLFPTLFQFYKKYWRDNPGKYIKLNKEIKDINYYFEQLIEWANK